MMTEKDAELEEILSAHQARKSAEAEQRIAAAEVTRREREERARPLVDIVLPTLRRLAEQLTGAGHPAATDSSLIADTPSVWLSLRARSSAAQQWSLRFEVRSGKVWVSIADSHGGAPRPLVHDKHAIAAAPDAISADWVRGLALDFIRDSLAKD